MNGCLSTAEEPGQLDCSSCDARFDSAWALCQHCQTEHKMSIFKSEVSGNLKCGSSNLQLYKN